MNSCRTMVSSRQFHNLFEGFMIQINTDFGLKYKAIVLAISPIVSGRTKAAFLLYNKGNTIPSLLFSGPTLKLWLHGPIAWMADAPWCTCGAQEPNLSSTMWVLKSLAICPDTVIRNLNDINTVQNIMLGSSRWFFV